MGLCTIGYRSWGSKNGGTSEGLTGHHGTVGANDVVGMLEFVQDIEFVTVVVTVLAGRVTVRICVVGMDIVPLVVVIDVLDPF